MNQIHVNRVLVVVAAAACRFAGSAGLGVPGRRFGRRGWCLAAVLAAVGVPGVLQPVALAGSPPVLNWVKKAPAASPPVREFAAVAYGAATGSVVLFGGQGINGHLLGDTWIWDGTTWAKQVPGASPPARWDASMAYDPAAATWSCSAG